MNCMSPNHSRDLRITDALQTVHLSPFFAQTVLSYCHTAPPPVYRKHVRNCNLPTLLANFFLFSSPILFTDGSSEPLPPKTPFKTTKKFPNTSFS